MDERKPIHMELLAPAGGMEQLRAAIRFGADAVYLAAERFGMRARAANFTLESIPAAVAEAHAAGVAVHVTCNVVMHDSDLDALPEYLAALDAAGVDALIVSDLGALELAKRHAPHVALHVSTQASVTNAQAARVWHKLGAKRIVCAREMSLEEIARLRRDTPPELEIEAFVHGAMCMAVSGRCLISSYLTGRSGNKGHCTQPCRWQYTLEEEKRPDVHFPIDQDERGTYIMNAEDLNMLAYLRELEQAGVGSIKIEGRNKKAFYVASVVSAYRRVLDGVPANEVAPELLDISHRPYSTGFYFGPAKQSCFYEGYEQRTMHVADVLDCQPLGNGEGLENGESIRTAEGRDTGASTEAGGNTGASAEAGRWLITALCRNRFELGTTVELLRPRLPIAETTVENLLWHPDPTEDDPAPQPVTVDVANRSCNRYTFVSCAPAQPGSFVRVRRFHRAGRELS